MTDLKLFTEYMAWADHITIKVLEKISEEEYQRSLGDLVGSIATKAGHLVGILDFFVKAIEGNPYDRFPSFSKLTKDELIQKWKELLYLWQKSMDNKRYGFLEIPLAKGKFVNLELVYADALFHSTHHRGQILSFLRILGKEIDDIHPKDVNVDFLNYLFKKQNQLILSTSENELKQSLTNQH